MMNTLPVIVRSVKVGIVIWQSSLAGMAHQEQSECQRIGEYTAARVGIRRVWPWRDEHWPNAGVQVSQFDPHPCDANKQGHRPKEDDGLRQTCCGVGNCERWMRLRSAVDRVMPACTRVDPGLRVGFEISVGVRWTARPLVLRTEPIACTNMIGRIANGLQQ
jgi:hypothetical protein